MKKHLAMSWMIALAVLSMIPGASGADLTSTNPKGKAVDTASAPETLYCVVDLSKGKNASSYPVHYL